jgi:phage terminase large subunit
MWDSVNPHTRQRRIDDAFPLELRETTRDHEMMIVFKCGSTFQLVGSDNFNSLVGSPPVGLIFSEYALSNPAAWAYLRPILLENGGWAGFNSTPRGNNHFKSLCKLAENTEGWFYQKLTVDETNVLTPEQIAGELAELQDLHGDEYGKSIWLQEYYCSFDAAIPGSIWGDCLDKLQNRGRICSVPHDPNFPVHTGWDLGRTDATAIWFFQIIAQNIEVIDYHESNLKDIPFYADLLRGRPSVDDSADVRAQKDRTKRYKYGTHWLPHDARARILAAGGKSIQQQMIDHNVGRIVIAKRLDHVDGIQAARATFPNCRFDRTNCGDGVDVLRHYHYEWDEENKVFLSRPAHDWASHGSSAFRTLSLSWKRPKESGPEAPIEERVQSGSINKMTFGQLKNQHLRKMRARREERM